MIIKSYIPETIVSNSELSNCFGEKKVAKLTDKLGILERKIASNEESALDMAVKACSKISQDVLNSIDFLIYCTQSPEYILPSTSCILQSRLGLSNSCGAIDINLGCSGYVYCLSVAKGLLESRMCKNVLIVTSDTYSKYIHIDDFPNRFVFGDAATATHLNAKDAKGIHSFDFGTDGEVYDNIIVKGKNFVNHDSLSKEEFFFMKGIETFNYFQEVVPFNVNKVLAKSSLSKDDIDHFIFHQANRKVVSELSHKIDVPDSQVVQDFAFYGNTVSSSIPLAFRKLLDRGVNTKVLLSGFGVGASWAGCIVDI